MTDARETNPPILSPMQILVSNLLCVLLGAQVEARKLERSLRPRREGSKLQVKMEAVR